MILKKKIPKEFYKLFRTKNRDAYMQFLVAIYEENNEVYTALGLTIEECRVIIADTIAKARIIWEDEDIEEEDEPDTQIVRYPADSPQADQSPARFHKKYLPCALSCREHQQSV